MATTRPSDEREAVPPRAPQNVSPVRARQGRLGVQVLFVLVAALVLAMFAWWAAELFGAGIAPPAAQQVGDPATVNPEPAN